MEFVVTVFYCIHNHVFFVCQRVTIYYVSERSLLLFDMIQHVEVFLAKPEVDPGLHEEQEHVIGDDDITQELHTVDV